MRRGGPDLSPAWRLPVVDRGTRLSKESAEDPGSRHFLSFVKSTAFAPSSTPLRVLAPPTLSVDHACPEAARVVRSTACSQPQATTEWQYLSEPVTATPGLTYSTNNQEFFPIGLLVLQAWRKSSSRPMYFLRGRANSLRYLAILANKSIFSPEPSNRKSPISNKRLSNRST